MREILFRGKRLDNGEWVEGNMIFSESVGKKSEAFIIPIKFGNTFVQLKEGNLGFRYWHRIAKETICQCTGLTDKSGKKIWENDIVNYWDTYSTESGLAEEDCIGKIVWDDETISFQVTGRLSAESYEVLGECNVIGNIFDNPELLQEVVK